MATSLDNTLDNKISQLVDKNAIIKKLDLRENKGDRRLIAGYANVSDIEDSQGDVMSHEALVNAWGRWSNNPDYCMLSLLHSNIPLAKVVFEEIIDSKGSTHRSGVDETGLYIVAEVRRDVTLADEIWGKIQSGEFRGFSIGGRNLNPQPAQCTGTKCVRPITDLELYEVAIVDHPANEVSLFNMLKSDDLAKLSEATKHLEEQVLAEGAIKISKRPCPVTGQYHILVKEGIDASKLFCPDKFTIIKKPVEGEEYVTLFDIALLRPESVLTGETLGGGVNPSSPQAKAPDTPAPQEELILDSDEIKEMETEEASSKEDESGLAKAPEVALAPITLETLMAQLARAIERIDSLEKIRKTTEFLVGKTMSIDDVEAKIQEVQNRINSIEDKNKPIETSPAISEGEYDKLEQLRIELQHWIELKVMLEATLEKSVEKVEKSADPAPLAKPTPSPAEPVKEPVKETVIPAPAAPPQEAPPVKAEPTVAAVVPVVQLASTPAPTPTPPKVEEIEVRGVAQPAIPVKQGLDLAGLYKKVSWRDIHEAEEASQKRK